MDSSKIVVSTSLSMSYLESLMMNIPTVVISNYNLEPMRKDAKEYLNLLIQSKILHFSPSLPQNILNKFGKILMIGGYLKKFKRTLINFV